MDSYFTGYEIHVVSDCDLTEIVCIDKFVHTCCMCTFDYDYLECMIQLITFSQK